MRQPPPRSFARDSPRLAITSTRSRRAGILAGSGKAKKVKLETFLVFNQQFLTLIRAGLPILVPSSCWPAARSCPTSAHSWRTSPPASKMANRSPEAFEAQGGFPIVYTTTLLAGERSGNLEEVLQRYLDFQRVSLTFRKKLIASLIYPAVLVVMVIGMFIFLITYVVPKFAELYEQLGTQAACHHLLSARTGQASAELRDLRRRGVGDLRLPLHPLDQDRRRREYGGSVRIRLPLIGPVWLKYQVGLFARTLPRCSPAACPSCRSLETAARSIDSRQISNAVFRGVETVREGKGLSVSLAATKLIPELAVEMIEVGESTGALPQMLNSVAEFFEEDVQTSLTAAMSLIEPIILIVMGIVVATILISLYLPIFSMSSGAGPGGGQ
jgi:type IV pilus assembly protein PilC